MLTPREPGSDGPRRLGDFELLREIGRGGMGVVYEARQVSLNRPVALKLLPPGLGLTPQAVQRFQREAQAAAKLHHTHIVPVYAVGETDGSHYYAMELIDGQPLTAIVRDLKGGGSNPLLDAAATQTAGDTPMPARDSPSAEATTSLGGTSLSDSSSGSRKWFETVARLVADVAEALHYAHGRGIVHRDIKPANLLLASDGKLCVTDFGLAQVAQEPGMTVSGSFLGTPAYMSPEQIAVGRIKVDHRTDIYSLGTVLYEMLTLERPFPGEGREQILAGIMTKEPKAPRRINPRIPQDLETICLKAIEKDPDRRYASAQAMAQDLRAYLGHGLIAARRAGPLRRGIKWGRRHPVAVAALVGVLAVAALGTGFQRFAAGERAQREVAEARVLVGRGEYRSALLRLEDSLRRAPGLIAARGLRAEVHMMLEHYPEAAAEAAAVLDANPGDWKAHAIRAIAARHATMASVDINTHALAVERLAPQSADACYLRALITEDPREAARLLEQALEIDPSHPLALARRARDLAFAWNDPPRAIATADRLLAARPRSALGRRTLAFVYFVSGDLDRAFAEIEKAVALDQDDAVTLNLRGRIRSARGEHLEAIVDFTRAIEIDPAFVLAYINRGHSSATVGRFDESIADARMALALNPEFISTQNLLLRALRVAGRKDEFRQARDRLVELADQYSIAQQRYDAYMRLTNWFDETSSEVARAREFAQKAILASPGAIGGYAVHAAILRRTAGRAAAQGDCARAKALTLVTPSEFVERGDMMYEQCADPNAARADFQSAIDLAPRWGGAFHSRAIFHKSEGHFELALSDLDGAIDLTPWYAAALYVRGEVLLDMEREGESLLDFERAFAIGAGSGGIGGWSYAEALTRLGRYDEALRVIDRTISLVRLPHQDRSKKAIILTNVGRLDEALAAIDDAIKIQPNDSAIHQIRGMILTAMPGRCDDAASALRHSEELAGQDWELAGSIAAQCAVWLAAACPQHYDADRALRLAEHAVRGETRDPKPHLALGAIAYRRSDLERARREVEAAIAVVKAPKDDMPEFHFLLAMIHAKAGEARKARDAFDRGERRMLRTYPKDPTIRVVRDEAAAVLASVKP